MNLLMKWTLLFAALMIVIKPSHAWNIGSIGRVNGPAIHTTYFITPNNAPFPVHGIAYAGTFVNGICQYNAVYDLGTTTIKTGDFVDIDGFSLKSVIGVYDCLTINYTYNQLVSETFQLISDGINYQSTFPATAEVTII